MDSVRPVPRMIASNEISSIAQHQPEAARRLCDLFACDLRAIFPFICADRRFFFPSLSPHTLLLTRSTTKKNQWQRRTQHLPATSHLRQNLRLLSRKSRNPRNPLFLSHQSPPNPPQLRQIKKSQPSRQNHLTTNRENPAKRNFPIRKNRAVRPSRAGRTLSQVVQTPSALRKISQVVRMPHPSLARAPHLSPARTPHLSPARRPHPRPTRALRTTPTMMLRKMLKHKQRTQKVCAPHALKFSFAYMELRRQ